MVTTTKNYIKKIVKLATFHTLLQIDIFDIGIVTQDVDYFLTISPRSKLGDVKSIHVSAN